MSMQKLRRDDWILAGVAVLLVVDLLFLPWFHTSIGLGGVSVSVDWSATDAPDGWTGVLAAIAALAVAVDLAVDRLAPGTQLFTLGGSRTATRLTLAIAAAGFMALKFLFHVHFSLFGWGFYVGVVLAAALVYFTIEAHEGHALLRTGRPGPGSSSGAGAH